VLLMLVSGGSLIDVNIFDVKWNKASSRYL
jgi:hypothetical protein